MESFMSISSSWSVADAKAQLSEILRLAKQGKPQVIGTQTPCVVISLEDYQNYVAKSHHDGRWLVERASRPGFDIELPSRHKDRDMPVLGD
jgi:prevent-host-death family protein